MAIFGGSKRTQQTVNETTVTNTSTGLEDIAGPAVVGSGNVLSVLDGGAIASAFEVGEAAIAMGRETVDDSLGFASDIFGQALGAQADLQSASFAGLQSLAMATSASSDDRVQKIALYAVLALAAVMVLPRLFGKGA